MARETKKPERPRSDILPTSGYVLSVDGKLKTRYEGLDEAMAAATKLKQSYPVIQAAVWDAAARSYLPVVLQAEDAEKAEG